MGEEEEDHLPEERLQPILSLPQEVWHRSRGFIVAAFVIVAALAWRDAIRRTVEAVWPGKNAQLVGVYVIAFMITIGAVLVSMVLGHNGTADL